MVRQTNDMGHTNEMGQIKMKTTTADNGHSQLRLQLNRIKSFWLKHQNILIVLLLFGLAFGLRIWQNTIAPPSPYWEEAAIGYDAYSILKTGRDHHGQAWPIVAFTSFGDYKPSLYFYSVVPSVAAFGLNTFAVRLPAVLFSSATVVVLYFLARRLTNARVARWSAFLLAIQPWSWQVGRVGFEVNLAVFLLSLGIYSLILAIDYWSADVVGKNKDRANKNKASLPATKTTNSLTTKLPQAFWLWSSLAVISFALAMYSYHAARLLAPLFGIATLVIAMPWRHSQLGGGRSLLSPTIWRHWLAWLPAAALGIALLAPLALSLTSPTVSQRWQETSVFAQPEPVETSNAFRSASDYSPLSRLIYHRYIFWTQTLLKSHLSHLSPAFLFTQGDANPRHSSQLFGALYPWEVITLTIGLIGGYQYFKAKRFYWLLVALTLISPVAAMLTTATPHALRALPLAVWLAWWSGLGVIELLNLLSTAWSYLTRKLHNLRRLGQLVPWLLAVFCLMNWVFLWVFFRYHSSIETAKEWQYGYQQLVEAVNHYQQPGETVYISRHLGRPAMYFFFYNQTDPRAVQASAQHVPKDQGEFLEFGNWRFTDEVTTNSADLIEAKPNNPSSGLNLYAMPNVIDSNDHLLETIYDLDGNVQWVLFRH